MDTLRANITALRDVVEKHKNDSALCLLPDNEVNEILKSDHLPIEQTIANLRFTLNSVESTFNDLLFVNDELKRECKELSEEIKLRSERRKEDIAKREAALADRNFRMKTAKQELSIYEKSLKIIFTSSEESLSATIFNPDHCVQVNLPITSLETGTSVGGDFCQPADEGDLKFTDDAIAEINKLWQQMEVSEKWKFLIMPTAESTTSKSSNNKATRNRKVLCAKENLER